MKKKIAALLAASLILSSGNYVISEAAFEPSVEAAYNTAIQGMDALDGLDVTVTERTTSASTNISSEKEVELQVSGLKKATLQADIRVETEDGDSESYYRGNAYYATTSDGKIKREMERSTIWEMINSHIYLDMTSNYLQMLCSSELPDGQIAYQFAATEETLDDYSKKLLYGSGEDHGLVIDALFGTMITDEEGHIKERDIQMIYTVNNSGNDETYMVQSNAVFHQDGEVVISLPDLSEYKLLEAEKPIETITPLMQTVYTTADVNVRAAGDINAVIIGGLCAGTSVTETGYTSDGWIQIQYNGAAGYVSGDYISTTKPVFTKDQTGTMYATAGVNIRDTYSADGAILGVLYKGQPIEISGKTTNGWIRVNYKGHVGYIFADYLSKEAPVADTYVERGYVSGYVTDASYGVITIAKEDGTGMETFNTMYAQMNLKDTIYTGDWVEIYYYGAGAPYTASVLNDYTRHVSSTEMSSVEVEGVITKLTPSRLELTGADGVFRTFDISNAECEMSEDLYEGKYVIVSWMSATNGSEFRDIEALRIRG